MNNVKPKILLTFDVELWTWRGDFALDIEQPLERLAEWLKSLQVPAVLFISLSNKGLGPDDPQTYLEKVLSVCRRLRTLPFLEFGVHPHCQNLPLPFPTPHDEIDHYSWEEIEAIIKWNSETLSRGLGEDVIAHRAARYRLPCGSAERFAKILLDSGLSIDSSDISIPFSQPVWHGRVLEVPPATEPELSSRLIVWSPEKMGLDELNAFAERAPAATEYLVMNFHSFSVTASAINCESLPVRIWSAFPPAAQAAIRPGLRLLKKGWRRTSQGGGAGGADGAGGVSFQILDTFVRRAKEEEFEFINFQQLHEVEGSKIA